MSHPTSTLQSTAARHAAEQAPTPLFNRLAIVDRQRKVLAYALPIVTHQHSDPALKSEALHQAYRLVDLEKYVADRPAFIWSSVEMLAGTVSVPPSAGGVGLLIHPSISLRADGAENVISLRERGIPSILVNFADEPGQRALLPFVTHVMIDVAEPAVDVAHLTQIAHNAGVSVIAENVQGQLGPAQAWDFGVDYIMGSIYQHLRAVDRRSLDAGEIQCLEVVRLLSAEDVDTGRIAEVLSSDPEMTVRVLHLVNSVAIGLPRRVDSLHHAIVMLGPTQLTTLVMASLISSRVQQMDALWFLLARAAACRELVGDDAGYTVGLLSAFAEETGIAANVLAEKALVSQEVASALVNFQGPLGEALAAVIAHERGDSVAIAATGWSPHQVARAYLTALPWALETVRQLNLV